MNKYNKKITYCHIRKPESHEITSSVLLERDQTRVTRLLGDGSASCGFLTSLLTQNKET